MELLKLAYGLDMTHVPFGGSGPVKNALLGGHVQVAAPGIDKAIFHVVYQPQSHFWPLQLTSRRDLQSQAESQPLAQGITVTLGAAGLVALLLAAITATGTLAIVLIPVIVDGLITGWHEPQASHLKLLEGVAGRELLERSYGEALRHGYLWHEFGDSHLLLP